MDSGLITPTEESGRRERRERFAAVTFSPGNSTIPLICDQSARDKRIGCKVFRSDRKVSLGDVDL